ncbi:hypothetical protein BDR26DRAFT_849928 [Obelidium mucronatum]|nr:hypothetical protein BDR26DRAFT_849928 [Obelidium mucronatum]
MIDGNLLCVCLFVFVLLIPANRMEKLFSRPPLFVLFRPGPDYVTQGCTLIVSVFAMCQHESCSLESTWMTGWHPR